MKLLIGQERPGSVDDQVAVDPDGQGGAVRAERRRPGRTQYTSLELLPLLREPQPCEGQGAAPDLPEGDDPDQLRFFDGLGVGLAMSVPLWAVIILVGHWLLF